MLSVRFCFVKLSVLNVIISRRISRSVSWNVTFYNQRRTSLRAGKTSAIDTSRKVTSSSDSRPENSEESRSVDQGFCSPDTFIDNTLDSSRSAIFEHTKHNGFLTESASNMSQESTNGSAPTHSFHDKDPEENDIEDHDSSISELSGLSDLSNISDQDWKPSPDSVSWVQRQITNGIDPRMILGEILPKGTFIPQNVNDGLLWRYIINMLNEPKRSKLTEINTMNDAVHLLQNCKNIIVLTGAGVSVSCGIPDFRSRDGIYARLSKDYPDLPDPQAMFDICYFRRDPRPFFKFAKEIYPGLFQPSPSHKFIKLLEKQGRLLRNYTQNIDTLEHASGIQNVITCHGSFATATCTICRYKVDASVIKEDIFSQRIPYCPTCPPELGERGIMKPDIVFFGEGLSDEFHEALAHDKSTCDLLIVMGSSLKVRPVAMIPSSIPMGVPQILINREPLKHLTFDIELLGDCDVIIGELCRRLEKAKWPIDMDIPRGHLTEVTMPMPIPLPSENMPQSTELTPLQSTEVNNNFDLRQTEGATSSLPQSEESNSCDYRGLSAIKLDDSEDGSNQEKPIVGASGECESIYTTFFPLNSKESLSKRLPDQSYLFLPPSRYIFQGAEVYNDDEDSSNTSTDYSSDSEDSPPRPSAPIDHTVADPIEELEPSISPSSNFELPTQSSEHFRDSAET